MKKHTECSMVSVFQRQVQKYGNKTCVSQPKNDSYIDVSWNQMNNAVRSLALYLLSKKIGEGDSIALFSENRYEWWLADLAVQSIKAVVVPMYHTSTSEEVHYILAKTQSKLCLLSGEEQLQKVQKIRKKLPELSEIIVFDETLPLESNCLSLKDAIKKGETYPNHEMLNEIILSIKPDDVASVVFTSGTSAEPKGVVLTHNNFYSDASNSYADITHLFTDQDIFLSFLPLSHVLERSAGYYIPLLCGGRVIFARSMNYLMEDFRKVRPTIIISVPRVYEKIRGGIMSSAARSSFLKKLIFSFGINTARLNYPHVCRNSIPVGFLKFRFKLADKIVLSKIKKAIGFDRLKCAISGGAPLAVQDAEFFLGMGIPIMEGYGLTETSPITHFNRHGEIKIGTVGRAINDTSVKIADDGEILVKGPQVMKGYYRDERATAEVMTEDGFFKTGDLGMVDNNGYLIITGRKKDIIVTSGGKNISPQTIEDKIKESPYICQVGLIGDKRKYVVALVIPEFEKLEQWAHDNQITWQSHKELIENTKVISLYEQEITTRIRSFSQVEQVKRFKLLDTEWTIEGGELTPKQSVKRRIVMEKYAREIDELYRN